MQLADVFASLRELDVPTLELVVRETIRIQNAREEFDSQRFSVDQIVRFYGHGGKIIEGTVLKIKKGRLYVHTKDDPPGRAGYGVPPSLIIWSSQIDVKERRT